MDCLENYPVITTEDDWLELADGEQAVLKGRLYGALKKGQDSLVLSTSTWDLFAVSVPGGYNGNNFPEGTELTLVVTRNEEGLQL